LKRIIISIVLILFLGLIFIYFFWPKRSAIAKRKSFTHKVVKTDTSINLGNINDNDFDEPGTAVKYDSVKFIDTLYITDRSGVEVKNHPYINSTTILARDMDDAFAHTTPKGPLKYIFGHRLAVLEKKDGWLGVMERITRRIKENGQAWLSDGWEEVYIPEQKTGKISDVKLISADLKVLEPENEDDTTKVYLKGVIDMTLVSKSEYEEKKTNAVDYLIEDTTKIKKKGVIELPYQKGFKRYVDNASEEAGDNYQEYNYLGQIPFLNKYLITEQYYESGDYKLIDKKTGLVTAAFTNYPHISFNKKYIISIEPDIYISTADLELAEIDGPGIKTILSASFKYWMPVTDNKAMFWGTDGCLYVPITHFQLFEEKSAEPQYLKISIL